MANSKNSKKPKFQKPTEDWIEEGFSSAEWLNLTDDERVALTKSDNGEATEFEAELAKEVRIRMREAARTKGPADTDTRVVVRELPEVSEPTRESALSIVGGVTTEQLKAALIVQTEQRSLIQQFIQDNLVVDIDYGKIHVVKNCPAEDRARGSCDKSYHFSKSILFKPGQEKIFSLFGITDELEKDLEVYEMLGNLQGLVAYKCVMFRGDNRVGEGRGAATLSGTQNDPNSTIKKAEKRARMDACLSLGFSAYFTQDLDDPEYKSQRDMMNERARNDAERIDKDEFGLMPRDPSLPIDTNERTTLYRMTLKAGLEGAEILEMLKLNGIADPSTMTSGQARDMLTRLKSNAFAAPVRVQEEVVPVTDDTDVANEVSAAADKITEANKDIPPESELVVDDDLKSNLSDKYQSIGLNSRGNMWFLKLVSGKPFGSFEKFTDADWRKAFDVIMGILDQTFDVPDEYIAGLVDDPGLADYTVPTNQSERDAAQVAAVFPGSEPVS